MRMKPSLKTRALYLYPLLLSYSLFLSAQRPSWINYDTNRGLPGNEAYKVFQDSKGYIWFATSQGICRFNGYEFFAPADTSSKRGSQAFLPAEDPEGNIWFARLDGTLYSVEKDTVRAWKYNHILDHYRGKFLVIEDFAFGEDGSVWLALQYLGLLEVKPGGAHRVVPENEESCLVFTTVGEKTINTAKVGQFGEDELRPGAWFQKPVQTPVHWENGKIAKIENLVLRSETAYSIWGLARLKNGDMIFFDDGSFRLVRDRRQQWEAPTEIRTEKLYESPDGDLFVASHFGSNPGLYRFGSPEALRAGRSDNLLPRHFVTDFICDREGGWWATTYDQGVFYCKNPDIEIFDTTTGLPSSDVVCLVDDGKRTVYAGFRPALVCAIDALNGGAGVLPPPPVVTREIWALYYDTLRGRLACSSPLHFLEKGIWKPFAPDGKGATPAKKISPDPSGRILWASFTYGFYRVDPVNEAVEHLSDNYPLGTRTFSVARDGSGNIWVATVDGLRMWKNGKYEPPPFDHPALKFQASDVKMLPGGGMAISLSGAGLLLRDPEGRFVHLTGEDGLTDDFITGLHIAGDGRILAFSNAGLNLLSARPDGSWAISTLTVKKGLPSDQVNDARVFGGQIWVATNKGLACLRKLRPALPMPAPGIGKISVNQREVRPNGDMQLSHSENTLAIRFHALSYRSEGRINYRYRLLGADSGFIYSKNREVNFVNLPPGKYEFEVQAQNEDGLWGPSSMLAFRISPAWWQTAWFRAVSATLLAALIFFLFQYRLRSVRRDARIREKIRELEVAALRAQMNPHFIFNCLNSIQHFIVENDPAAASRYLSRFARLVRLALHGSVDGRHSLREEMDMLDNYLALEQLRFQGKFEYEILAGPGVDPDEHRLPPMLVQPFVENAILHGMKNKTGKGRISIVFSRDENGLMATVTDNGPGFLKAENGALETSGHKSVGMMLTQRRLEILAGQDTLLRENITGEKGGVQGSRVVLHIPAEFH